MPSGTRVAGYAVDTATIALSTAYANKATLDGTDEALATNVPTHAILGLATIQLESIVTAVSVTWFISEDTAGNHIIAGPVTSTIVGITSGKGGVAETLNTPWVTNEVAGKLYIWAKLDAGTANIVKAKISFQTPS